MSFEPVIGLEIHAQLRTRTKIFCGCSTGVRRAAEFARLPGLPRPAGRAAGAQSPAVDYAHQGGAGARLRVQTRRRSSRARTTSIPTCRRATRSPSTSGRSRSAAASRVERRQDRAGHRPDPHPHGRGRGQVAARRLLRFRSPHLHRLQPQRRAAHRNCQRAGHALGRRGRGVLQPPARHPRLARRQRRQHGRGQPALRRQRLGAAERRRRRSAPRPRSRTSTRSATCRRRSNTRSTARSTSLESGGRVVQETRLWDAAAGRTLRCAARKRRTTIATSPSPICRRCVVDAARIDAVRATMPELPDARRQRFVAAYGIPDYDAGVLTQSASSPTTSRRWPPRRNAKAASNWVMGELLRTMNERGRRASATCR